MTIHKNKAMYLLVIVFFVVVGLVSFFFRFAFTPPPDIVALEFPVVHLVTPQHPFNDRNLWQEGTITITNMDKSQFADVEDLHETDVRVRGRGNSTWWMDSQKKPLRLRFEQPHSVLGSQHKATDWILLSNQFDPSLLRNYSALYFAKHLQSSMQFVPMARNVHLYINDAYVGVYLLTDERDVSDGRLELMHDSNPEVSEYLIELDFRAHENGSENVNFVKVNNRLYDIRFPSQKRLTPHHVDYIKNYISQVSLAIQSEDFATIISLIDVATWVDFYLVQEFFMNKDVYQSSVFMSIQGQGNERRIHMGPVWDFDLAAGNMRYQLGGTHPEGLYVARVHYWYAHLMNIPEFYNAVALRWLELNDSAIPTKTINHIKDTARTFHNEFLRNFERHPILGTSLGFNSAHIASITSFEGQVDFLTDWLRRRSNWLTARFQQ